MRTDIEKVIGNITDSVQFIGEEIRPEHITERMRRFHIPAISIAVVNDGRLDWAEAFGVTTLGGSTVNTNTRFQSASISKAVTALGVLQLVERGSIKLDEDIRPHLKSWKIPASKYDDLPVTLRTILTHCAGFNVGGFAGYPENVAVPSVVEVLEGRGPANSEAVLRTIPPGADGQFTHGTYSGGAYTIMQLLMQDLTGLPFSEYMQQAVLTPLGMTNSHFIQPLPKEQRANAAFGHEADGSPLKGGAFHTFPELAAAGLWSTPSDLAKVICEIQKIARGEKGLISKGMCEELLTYQWTKSEEQVSPILSDNMGLGFFLGKYGNTTYFQHSGGNTGYRCLLLGTRDEGVGAVVVTNFNVFQFIIPQVFLAIGSHYQWPAIQPLIIPRVNLPAAVLEHYCGRFETTDKQTVEVFLSDGKLFAKSDLFYSLPVELSVVGENQFLAPLSFTRIGFSPDLKSLYWDGTEAKRENQ
jgi:CubicO group peptidase (beta-lactamase class C family)